MSPAEDNFFLTLVQPGDVLLYRRKGFFNSVIEHATNAPVSHTECFMGEVDGKTVTIASRNGIGVNFYDPYFDGLACILRPKADFDKAPAVTYCRAVLGQGYDWTGLWRAFVANTWGRNSTKQWCSENTTKVQRAGGIEPFDSHIPADMVAPGDFLFSTSYRRVWTAKDFPV